ncbi:MAG: bifunctional oligoribonuclease/PAP phosphatase NrnA [Candidatus Magasanikbacteria bacterium]|jgi:bifunctional oligoribonuclease and PAP phosphatase NrnA|nr:bifunctional oligoribonuclease/PAP phosphatase NrnA [Candidatus Magasanikbacteria bacterium]MBT4314535.1 bifunctional oligoribonuclease/PAP phosphatase NrnA [Candidatus Magasanikbacteria bacterium]MBT4547631.1 bifunctional oligoribonuclease/PAP phosphatase NrnA [Candidatus Magasanikbacteria bacterium]MBT6819300.1 bifunctional oligoribonuclease/PAP phosphatase NrnA [Candidatus Magasanikbacteria bacterium]
MHRTAKHIHNEIKKADKILLICHQNPDGDALGSISALAHFLDIVGKQYETFCLTESSKHLSALPHIVIPNADRSIWQNANHDLIIVLDSGNLEYAGIDKYIEKLNHEPTIINIDHHPTNNKFGSYNLVIEEASSTTEILYFFFKYNNIEITKNMAMALLTGLITDTENFSNSGTTENSLKVASSLIHRGANFNQVKTWFLKNKPVTTLKLWGVVLSRLTLHEKSDVIYTYITQNDIKSHGGDETESEGIANFLNNLSEGQASLFLKEQVGGKFKGSLRTTRDGVDVSVIAEQLGGGGHKKAAGFSIDGPVEDALNQIWQTVESLA